MATVLVTGFEAFGNTPINPAESVARALEGKKIASHKIVSRIVPNNFFECIEPVCSAIEQVKPGSVIILGEYGGRATITVERLAQNFNDSPRYQLVDNRGKSMQGKVWYSKKPRQKTAICM